MSSLLAGVGGDSVKRPQKLSAARHLPECGDFRLSGRGRTNRPGDLSGLIGFYRWFQFKFLAAFNPLSAKKRTGMCTHMQTLASVEIVMFRLFQTVPFGVLCFLSSYKSLEKLMMRWQVC